MVDKNAFPNKQSTFVSANDNDKITMEKCMSKNYICDLCDEYIPNDGDRWHCTVRKDYDVCSSCSVIPQPHKMVLADNVCYEYDWGENSNVLQCMSSSLSTRVVTKDKVSLSSAAGKSESANSLLLIEWLHRYFLHFQGPVPLTSPTEINQSKDIVLGKKQPLLDIRALDDEEVLPLHSSYNLKTSAEIIALLPVQPIHVSYMLQSSPLTTPGCKSSGESNGSIAYDTDIDAVPVVHPIYLQHHGHSRMVVGYEKVNKNGSSSNSTSSDNGSAETSGRKAQAKSNNITTTSLLMYDPACDGAKLKKNLENSLNFTMYSTNNTQIATENKIGAWQRSIKRGLHTFQHGAYQIVYVSGIMNAEERERSKLIIGESVNAEIGELL